MSQPSLADLFARSTVADMFNLGIAVARQLKVPVDTWDTGDPTRSLFLFVANYLGGAFETIAERYTATAFLSFIRALAERDPGAYPWLVRHALEMYGYEADEATFATVRMTLTNGAGGLYTEADLAAGNVSYQHVTTGRTYTATSGPLDADGNPAPLKPISAAPDNVRYQDIVADDPGSASSAAAGEIVLLTAIPGVTATNPVAAQALDAESPASIEAGCREKLGPLSPKGPADAYDSVAKNAALTGQPGVTRSRTYDDSLGGVVRVYLAGPSGAVTAQEVADVEAAIVLWSTPMSITPIVASAINRVVNVSYRIWLYDSLGKTAAEVETTIAAALAAFFLARPIGGDIIGAIGTGQVFVEGIKEAIAAPFGAYFIDLELVTPGADVAVTEQEVPVVGTVTPLGIAFEPRASA